MTRYFRLQKLLDRSIDFDFYRRRAIGLRRGRIRYFFRRKFLLRQAMYAAAVCVGLAVGEAVPLPTTCLNCEYIGGDIADIWRSTVEHDGTGAFTGNILPANFQ